MKDKTKTPRLTVKKSVFFGTVLKVHDEQSARESVKGIKKGDKKARHVAFAFRIDDDRVIEGMSDAGEPRGTAGLPILMLLRNHDLSDVLVTVTRYWGGIKLGPGNLKRAYRDAAIMALEYDGYIESPKQKK